jgi:hypothetical protein
MLAYEDDAEKLADHIPSECDDSYCQLCIDLEESENQMREICENCFKRRKLVSYRGIKFPKGIKLCRRCWNAIKIKGDKIK